MFGLLQRRLTKSASAYRIPAGVRVYAIGDVHGCLAELRSLMESIKTDCGYFNGETRLVFVGDFVDRGPDSKGVIDFLVSGNLPGDRHHFLMGNHEEAMLQVLEGDTESLSGWLRFGGAQTLESYGINRVEIYRSGIDLPVLMRQAIPHTHADFLRRLEDQVRIGDYLFVHAGIRPGTPLAEQDQFDLRWIREEFLLDDETDHGMMVVHGHTISTTPELRPNRIGIDTGCYSTGRLTALVLEDENQRFLST